MSVNYRFSVAETLLGMKWGDRYNVIEFGAPSPGSLDLPLWLARPDVGVLTVIGREHYSQYGSLEAIAREKGKLVLRLPADGVAVLNRDDPLVRGVGEQFTGRKIWIGSDAGATLRLLKVRSVWPEPLVLTVEHNGVSAEVATRLHGEHLALPVLTALGVALALDVPLERAIAAISHAEPTEGRMQVLEEPDGVVFVRDDWKAPHWSLDAPFKFMADAKATRKIIVLGTISDSRLGPSQRYPRAARAAREVADLVLCVGMDAFTVKRSRFDSDSDAVRVFADLQQASVFLKEYLVPGDLVLIKGTNLQDHLVRLLLDRRRSVTCWRVDCGRNDFCDHCEKVREQEFDTADSLIFRNDVSNSGV